MNCSYPPDSYAILENLNPKLSRKTYTYKYNNIIDQVNDLWKRQYAEYVMANLYDLKKFDLNLLVYLNVFINISALVKRQNHYIYTLCC